MLYALGVLIFALGLLASIALHEIGHMVPAKKFGVKVTQYMVGFGPTVWSRKKGDTEYGLKAIPLGGYIRMIGMVPPARADGKRSRWPRRFSTAIEDFRQVSRAEVHPGDEPRQFYRLTPGKKMIVMLGGPTMNLIIYLVLTVVLLTAFGLPKSEATTKVAQVVKCVVAANATPAQQKACTQKSPAALAGLKAGDRIVAVDGVRITGWKQLTDAIEPAAGKTLHLVVLRNGQPIGVTVTPVRNVKYVSDTSTKTKDVGFIGVAPTTRYFYAGQGVLDVPREIGRQVHVGIDAIGSYPQKLKSLWQTVFEGKQRDPQGAIGVVGIGRIGGQIADSHVIGTKDKAYTLITLLASVNLLLFFFNLLPLLPLDGGHVAGAIVEAVKRGRARLRARGERRRHPDSPVATRPQIFVDTAQMLPVMYAVASVLILVTLLTLYADIVKPVNIG
jgi:membrane-associated protease RseP (regulator of RpoE activity)